MRREFHVRFCERLGVRFPWATHRVMAFDDKRVLAVLGKRLERFGLKLHTKKTRLVDFRPHRPNGESDPGVDGSTFDFLGFPHAWGKSRTGQPVVRQVTAKSRFARALAAVTDWQRRNRHLKTKAQHAHLSQMMRGHYAYYGVTGNNRQLGWFAHQVRRIWRKWLLRRCRGQPIP